MEPTGLVIATAAGGSPPPVDTIFPVTAVPAFVIVPEGLMAAPLNVIVPVVALLLMVRLLEPVIPPENVVETAVPVFPMVKVPAVGFVARLIGLAKISPVVPIRRDAALLPAVSPKVTTPEVPPRVLAEVVATTVPCLITSPPLNVFTPESVNVPAFDLINDPTPEIIPESA